MSEKIGILELGINRKILEKNRKWTKNKRRKKERPDRPIIIRNTERDFRGIIYTPWPSGLTEPVG